MRRPVHPSERSRPVHCPKRGRRKRPHSSQHLPRPYGTRAVLGGYPVTYGTRRADPGSPSVTCDGRGCREGASLCHEGQAAGVHTWLPRNPGGTTRLPCAEHSPVEGNENLCRRRFIHNGRRGHDAGRNSDLPGTRPETGSPGYSMAGGDHWWADCCECERAATYALWCGTRPGALRDSRAGRWASNPCGTARH